MQGLMRALMLAGQVKRVFHKGSACVPSLSLGPLGNHTELSPVLIRSLQAPRMVPKAFGTPKSDGGTSTARATGRLKLACQSPAQAGGFTE